MKQYAVPQRWWFFVLLPFFKGYMIIIPFKSEVSSECSWFLLSCQLSILTSTKPCMVCQVSLERPFSLLQEDPCSFAVRSHGCLIPLLSPLLPKTLTPASSWLKFTTVGPGLPIQHHLRAPNSWLVICTVITQRAGFLLSQTISLSLAEIGLLIDVESLGRQNQCENTAGK